MAIDQASRGRHSCSTDRQLKFGFASAQSQDAPPPQNSMPPPVAPTSLRDRTSEFSAVVDRLRKHLGIVPAPASGLQPSSGPSQQNTGSFRPGGLGSNGQDLHSHAPSSSASHPLGGGVGYSNTASLSSPPPQPGSGSQHQPSEFARRAADIGHGIHRTSLKLGKLAKLAQVRKGRVGKEGHAPLAHALA